MSWDELLYEKLYVHRPRPPGLSRHLNPKSEIPNTTANQSVDSLCRDGADAQYAILKQKPYNFTTNTQKPYLSIQASSLSTFVISKTHISGQKPRGRQLNAKVCDSKSAIFRLLFVQPSIMQQRYLANGLSTYRHFSTKLILLTTRSSTSTQRLDSFKFTLVNKSHSQHSTVVAVRCEGRHFLICTHAHTKSRSQAKYHAHWSGNDTGAQAKLTARAWRSLLALVIVGKVYQQRWRRHFRSGQATANKTIRGIKMCGCRCCPVGLRQAPDPPTKERERL